MPHCYSPIPRFDAGSTSQVQGHVPGDFRLCCLAQYPVLLKVVWFAGFACKLKNSEGRWLFRTPRRRSLIAGPLQMLFSNGGSSVHRFRFLVQRSMLNDCVRLRHLTCLHVMVPRIPWPRSRRRCRKKWSRCWLQQRRRRRFRLLALGDLHR